MARLSKENHMQFLLIVGLLSWLLPGGGYFVLGEKKRAIIMFVTISLILCAGLYIGSIGVIDLVGLSPSYVKASQVMNPPIVLVLSHYTAGGGYPVYGWPNEIGQIYTMVSGLLNLLCVVNAVSLAYLRRTEPAGSTPSTGSTSPSTVSSGQSNCSPQASSGQARSPQAGE